MENKKDELNKRDLDSYIQNRYRNAIDYYWAASKSNKRWYKTTRSLTVFFGALVTLVSSMASSEIIADLPTVKMAFTLGTPILAFFLTIIAGFSQSFQWGSTWQNMILTAQQLEKELDKYLVTPINERDFNEEVEKLNGFVITETTGFFERMLGGSKHSKIKYKLNNSGIGNSK